MQRPDVDLAAVRTDLRRRAHVGRLLLRVRGRRHKGVVDRTHGIEVGVGAASVLGQVEDVGGDELLGVLGAVHIRAVDGRVGQLEHVLQRAVEREVAVGVAILDAGRRAGLVGQDAEHRLAVAAVARSVAVDRAVDRPAAVGVLLERVGDGAVARVPAAAGVEAGGGVAFVEHQHDGDALLAVLPQRRGLDLLHQLVDVVVAAGDDGAAGGVGDVVGDRAAVAGHDGGGAAGHGALDGDAVHVVALVGDHEVDRADVAVGQVGAQLVVVVVGRDGVVGAVLQVGVPLAAAQRAVAVLEVGFAAHVLVGHARMVLGAVQLGRQRQRQAGGADDGAVAADGAGGVDVVLRGDGGVADAVDAGVLARVHRLAVGAPVQAGRVQRDEQVGLAHDVVADAGRLGAGRGERRLGQTGLALVRRRQILYGVGAGGVAVPLAVVGDAEVVGAADGGVVRLARIAGGVVAGQLVAGLQVAVDLRRERRVQDGRGGLVFQHDDEHVVIARHAFDVEGGLLRLQEGDGGAAVGGAAGGGGGDVGQALQRRIAARHGQRVRIQVFAVELGGGVGVAVGQRVRLELHGALACCVGDGVDVAQHGRGGHAQAGGQVGFFGRVVAAVGFHGARHIARQRADDDGRALFRHLRGDRAQRQATGHFGAAGGVDGAGADIGQQRADGAGLEREGALGIGGDRVFAGVADAVVVGVDTDAGALIVAAGDGRVGGAARFEGGGDDHAAHRHGRCGRRRGRRGIAAAAGAQRGGGDGGQYQRGRQGGILHARRHIYP